MRKMYDDLDVRVKNVKIKVIAELLEDLSLKVEEFYRNLPMNKPCTLR